MRGPRLLSVGVAVCVAGGVAAAASSASSAKLAPRTISVGVAVVVDGQDLTARLRAPSGANCVLKVAAKGVSMTFPAISPGSANRAEVHWSVPRAHRVASGPSSRRAQGQEPRRGPCRGGDFRARFGKGGLAVADSPRLGPGTTCMSPAMTPMGRTAAARR